MKHPMGELRKQAGFEKWMNNFVLYDYEYQTYVGYDPYNDELCREAEPSRFLLLWEEAREEWNEQNS